jgi:outer membrane murein-binding lipoprotein Lpp
MDRFRLCACGGLAVLLVSGCWQSDDSRRIAQLESRLATLEARIQSAQAKWSAAAAAVRPEAVGTVVVDSVPSAPQETIGFLDGMGISFGSDFDWQTRKVLAEGPATIRGKITADGRPRAGVKLRLFLTGVRSAWTTSDSSGNYVVRVPPGKYRYHGFELDGEAANRVLPGMLQRDRHGFMGERALEAKPDIPGKGPDFDFVTAITPLSPLEREIVPRKSAKLQWLAFPGASRYEVNLYEGDRGGRGGRRSISVGQTLATSDTFFVIPDRIALSSTKLYVWTVTGFDSSGQEISRSPDVHRRESSFEVE